MPIIKALAVGVSAGAARTIASSNSWQKYPMTFVKQNGEIVQVEPNINALEIFGELAKEGEKERLLALKAEGYSSKIKDYGSRYQTPAKEWDHLILSFTKEESYLLTDEEKQQYRDAIIKAFSDPSPLAGDGRRMVAISEGHDDTGDFHFHILVHRYGVNHETKYIHTAIDLGRYSEPATQANMLNMVLAEAELSQITDWVGPRGSIYEDTRTSNEAKEMVTKAIEEAGGEADLTTQPSRAPGSMRAEREERPSMEPDEKLIQEFVDWSTREAKRLAEQTQKAATNAALGQHALKALKDKKTAEEQKERAEHEKNVAIRERDQSIQEKEQALTTLEEVKVVLSSAQAKNQRVEEVFSQVTRLMPDGVKQLPIEDQSVWLSKTIATAAHEIQSLAKDDLVPETILKKDISAQVSFVARNCRDLNKANDSLSFQLKENQSQLAQAKEENTALLQKQEEVQRDLAVVKEDLTKTMHREQKLNVKVEELSTAVTSYKEELHTASAQVGALQAQLESSMAMINQSKVLSEQQRSIIDSQEAQIIQSQNLLKRSEEALHKQEKTIVGFEQKLIEAEEKSATYKSELDALKKQLEQALAEATKLRGQQPGDEPPVLSEDLELAKKLQEKEKKGPGPKDDEGGPA